MRWAAPKPYKCPKLGDKRVVKKFLWFPKCLDQEYRWLETCYIEQEYTKIYTDDEFVRYIYVWQNKHWILENDTN